ncbi:hypothetical protein CV014_03145 [Nostoc sp. CMAA1605]|nr:hypothetical protein [Nostoc sp. CMAA1605]
MYDFSGNWGEEAGGQGAGGAKKILPQSPVPNPQSPVPIPNPQSPIPNNYGSKISHSRHSRFS